MEGYLEKPPSPLIPRFWSPGWNSVQSVNKYQSEVGGPLAGGDPGIRLIAPKTDGKAPYFQDMPEPFAHKEAEIFLLPRCHIFGSEELSSRSPGIVELVSGPYIGLNQESLDNLGVKEGEEIGVRLGTRTLFLNVRLMPDLPEGTGALPVGFPGIVGTSLPAHGKLKKTDGINE